MQRMTQPQFFLELLHRLRKYSDALVLFKVIQQGADRAELKISATTLALDLLGGHVNKWQVQRSLQRLGDLGLLTVRIHENYRTHIQVDAHALRVYLRQPISAYLPGLCDETIPLLDALEDEALRNYEQDANQVINKAARPAGPDAAKPDQPDSA